MCPASFFSPPGHARCRFCARQPLPRGKNTPFCPRQSFFLVTRGKTIPFRPWQNIQVRLSAPNKARIGADRGFETGVSAKKGQNRHRESSSQQYQHPALGAHPTERLFSINNYQSIHYKSNQGLWNLVTFRKCSITGNCIKQSINHPPLACQLQAGRYVLL